MSTSSMIDRRELLRRAAYLIGGAISAPAALGILQGCTAKKPSGEWKPAFLTPMQGALVAEVADIIIPRTDTPGAKDVGVPAFIDSILKDVYPKTDQDRFLTGLEAFDTRARDAHGKSFLDLGIEQCAALVREAHDEAVKAAHAGEGSGGRDNRPFILMMKELTMLGFFTSEPGATQVLQYIAVPGPYQGCVPLGEAGNGKTWATEQSQAF